MTTAAQTEQPGATIPGQQAQAILSDMSGWGDLTTIVIHLGCVFEFKGPMPMGANGHGYYNLDGPTPGLHGHLLLSAVDHIAFQDKLHRGKESYALVFVNSDGENMFKVFLGRDESGRLFDHQIEKFKQLKSTYSKDVT